MSYENPDDKFSGLSGNAELSELKARCEYAENKMEFYKGDVGRLESELAEANSKIRELEKIQSNHADSYQQLQKMFHDKSSELDDYKNSARMAADEKCTADERHCACVPYLRKSLDRAKELLGKVRDKLPINSYLSAEITEFLRSLGETKGDK